ncbi:hypothetical protein MRB53_026894 [Persea americana]|uniref:Uncharacterized protein n=1 Tax=Persea americana TaxID=3435 RepID=A0ACC2LK41_PERAE|nr:hypothetical protein MRB53_026894 [Persea americana]|eukprot:TRINITY_DN1001_c1_g1_i1.p1 TRINITY_DN1001_c1_g1~~TRINITY_DN1001_c1_g1_i1.p1  ORF type:complete len:478 (+),score=66.62 TRINITY_DN1001_c1_g1_i1:118-1551(+)
MEKMKLIFLLFTFFFSLLNPSSSFTPSDNHLLSCGSTTPTTIDNRVFLADSDSGFSFLAAPRSISLKDQNPSPDSSDLYHTARIFTRPSSYHFRIKTKGTHLIRLHFSPFSSQRYNLSSAVFHVSALGFSLLRGFSVPHKTHVVKDYIIKVDGDDLVISFTPVCRKSFAFVNAIEVISAPKDLIADVAQIVGFEGIRNYEGLLEEAMETVYRINVGGRKVTPFNDTVWRTWIPDENFLHLKAAGKAVSFSGRIKYQVGRATREIAPDNVYNSARVMNDANVIIPNFNVTWVFPVNLGYRYLVRMHFCDIVSIALNQLYFNVYLNGYLVYKDLDLSRLTEEMLASPYYVDFVVDPEVSGDIRVSIGPSSLSRPSTINAILNGLEIMKISNSMRSLDGEFKANLVKETWLRGNVGVFLCSVLGGFAFVSAMMAAYMLVSRRWPALKDSVAWSPLPVDASEGNLKNRNSALSGKLGYAKI